MANDTIGTVPCAFCSQPAPVRKNAKQKLYYVCDGCGIVQPNMPGFQDWILERATINGAQEAAGQLTMKEIEAKPDATDKAETVELAPRPAASPAPQKPTTPTTPDKPKRGGFGLIRF